MGHGTRSLAVGIEPNLIHAALVWRRAMKPLGHTVPLMGYLAAAPNDKNQVWEGSLSWDDGETQGLKLLSF